MSLFPDFCAHTFRNTWLQLTSNMSPPRHCIAALPLQATIVHCIVLCCIVLYCIVLYCIVLYCIIVLNCVATAVAAIMAVTQGIG